MVWRSYVFFFMQFWLTSIHGVFSQNAELYGTTIVNGKPLAGVQLFIEPQGIKLLSDEQGHFRFQLLKAGTHTLSASYPGFLSWSNTFDLLDGDSKKIDIELQEDALFLHEMVVTGSRNQIKKQESPVIISTISSRTLEASQALVIAEGLHFMPGLRVENNCQNCGFNQLRMNGLDGAYTQILINSRPIFSALAGVYGLELLPANMVDRIEVIRGGGSVLYGGNAIAGTVNILTKDPIENQFEIGYNQGFTYLERSDRTITMNASIVGDNLKSGVSIFGFNRNREAWDANLDGFTELTAIQNTTMGFDVFRNGNKNDKIKLGAFFSSEFRRGGNKLDLEPHQADLAEQLQHRILNATVSYEKQSKDRKHHFAIYGASQFVDRSSYYGSGGGVFASDDTLSATQTQALNAYGRSNDLSLVGGLQSTSTPSKKMVLISGSEVNYNDVDDQMPGYDRSIAQRVNTTGIYSQAEWNLHRKLTLLLGGRYDMIQIRSNSSFGEESFAQDQALNAFVPRFTTMYRIRSNLKLRASFAQGYRAPQAFNEDLHIETVGGSARFIRLSPDLKTERSNSGTLSLNLDKKYKTIQVSALVEGFHTTLEDPFVLSDQQELPSGILVQTKRNGEGAYVQGINLELNIAYRSILILQSGGTLQRALYSAEELIWQPEQSNQGEAVTTSQLLRTPRVYAFYSLFYHPVKRLKISATGIFTGTMIIAHTIDPETTQIALKETPTFLECNFKVSYDFPIEEDLSLEWSIGLQNAFHSYQSDFDSGPLRDASYVYGPMRPRTFFVGIKLRGN